MRKQQLSMPRHHRRPVPCNPPAVLFLAGTGMQALQSALAGSLLQQERLERALADMNEAPATADQAAEEQAAANTLWAEQQLEVQGEQAVSPGVRLLLLSHAEPVRACYTLHACSCRRHSGPACNMPFSSMHFSCYLVMDNAPPCALFPAHSNCGDLRTSSMWHLPRRLIRASCLVLATEDPVVPGCANGGGA